MVDISFHHMPMRGGGGGGGGRGGDYALFGMISFIDTRVNSFWILFFKPMVYVRSKPKLQSNFRESVHRFVQADGTKCVQTDKQRQR